MKKNKQLMEGVEALYCVLCDKTFLSIELLYNHINDYHHEKLLFMPLQETEMEIPDIKANVEDTATTSGSGGSSRMYEAIGLLTDLYAFKNKKAHYAFCRSNNMKEFYRYWIVKRRAYENREEVDKKVNELFERFKYYMNKNVEAPTDPDEIEIFRHSYWVWGYDEIDSVEEIGSDLSKKDSEKSSSSNGKKKAV